MFFVSIIQRTQNEKVTHQKMLILMGRQEPKKNGCTFLNFRFFLFTGRCDLFTIQIYLPRINML